MKATFIVRAFYKGSEEFKPEGKDEVYILHKIVDHTGHIFKVRMDFVGEPNKLYDIVINLGSYYKEGEKIKYWNAYQYNPSQPIPQNNPEE